MVWRISATSSSSRVRIFLPTYCSWRRRPSWSLMVWHSRMASRTSSGMGTRLTRSRGSAINSAPSFCRAVISRLSCDLEGRSYSCSNSLDWKPQAPRFGLGMIFKGWNHSINDCYDNSFTRPAKENPPMTDSVFIHSQAQLRQLAQDVLRFAREKGGTDAAVEISEGSGL